jgi:hypothetical protein
MVKSKLARMANGKVLVGLLIAGLAFLPVFQYRNQKLKALAEKGAFSEEDSPTLDSDRSYDATIAHELFRKLGHEGRQLYAWTEITLDLIFPIIYSLFLSLLIIYIFQKFSNAKSPLSLAMLPFIAMAFDYGENILIAVMLFAYPQKHSVLALVASLFTKLKWGFIVLSFGTILFGLIFLVVKLLSKQAKTH